MKVENLTAALANALKNAGIIRKSISEETLNKVCGDMANSFKKEFDDAVKNLSGGVSEEKVSEMVQNALANILKQTGEGSVAAAINSAAEQAVLAKVPDATKLATTEAVNKVQGEVTELKKEVANKLGGKGNEKTSEESGEVKNGIVKNKRGAAYAIGGFGN